MRQNFNCEPNNFEFDYKRPKSYYFLTIFVTLLHMLMKHANFYVDMSVNVIYKI
jgi:hypothetical protein